MSRVLNSLTRHLGMFLIAAGFPLGMGCPSYSTTVDSASDDLHVDVAVDSLPDPVDTWIPDVPVDPGGPGDLGVEVPDGASDASDVAVAEPLEDVPEADAAILDTYELISDGFECPEGALCELEFKAFCDEGRCSAQGQCVATPIPGCCLYKSTCADMPLGPCEEVQCVAYQCVGIPIPGCCVSDMDCAVDFPCAESFCDPSVSRCSYCPGDCPCSANLAVMHKSIEGITLSSNGFSTTDYDSNDNVRWQVDSKRALSPPSSLYMGDPLCRTYYTGVLSAGCEPLTAGQDASTVRVILYSPVMNLSQSFGSAGSAALFWYWSDVEPDLGLGPAEPDVLRVSVDLLDGTGLKWPTTSILDAAKNTQGQWLPLAFDLAPYAGKVVRLRLEFDTFDGQLNAYEGIYVDEFQVLDKCPGGCCQEDLDCPAAVNPCSEAKCLTYSSGTGSICANVPISGDCLPCTADANCEDANPCTTNTCTEEGVCATEIFCCFGSTVFEDGFEAGLGAWSLTDNNLADGVTWQASALAASEGLLAAYFGDTTTQTYEAQGAVEASILSPLMDLPEDFGDGGSVALEFELRLDTEWDGGFYLNPLGIDRLRIEVMGAGFPVEVWSSDEISGTTLGEWLEASVDLSPWAGQSIQIRITFDSVDENANDHEGAFIDNLVVRRNCL